MFGPPGYAYVFLVYGLHWHFNVVTGAPGQPHAVLIRAVQPLRGLPLMAARRGTTVEREFASGPGKLCQAFAIDRAAYGLDLCGNEDLFLSAGERAGAPRRRVARSARIGVDYAGTWAARKFRFFDRESPFVSPTRAPPKRK
jgi:DNA-3-methyladenine glycosylase